MGCGYGETAVWGGNGGRGGARGGLPFARSFVGDEALTVGRTDAGGFPTSPRGAAKRAGKRACKGSLTSGTERH